MLYADSIKDRERDILKLMAQGLNNTQIADALYLAIETVRWYNKQIYSKLGVHNRTHAVIRAQELGVLEADEVLVDDAVPNVQYVENNGVYIAYQVFGQGEIDIIHLGGFISHLECAWEQADFVQVARQLSSMGRVILMDKRGFGLSDRVLDTPSLNESVCDIYAVMQAVGSKKALLISSCEGASAMCQFAYQYPEKALGLVLINASIKGTRSPDFPWALPYEKWNSVFENMQKSWGQPYAIDYFIPNADAQTRQWWAKYLRLSASPGIAIQAVKMMRDIDMSAILPHLHIPTLVMHARGNRVIRVGAGRYVANQLPNARYYEHNGNSHIWWVDSEGYLNAIEDFVAELVS